MNKISADIFSISDNLQFEQAALEVFRFQASECRVYAEFISALGVKPDSVKNILDIPCMPIGFFKSHKIISGNKKEEIIFISSGTGGIQSKHFVSDLSLYENSFRRSFEIFYGDISAYAITALLPSYLERDGSSLIYMVDDLIQSSKKPQSRYFLNNHDELYAVLTELQKNDSPSILIGVTYALLDFIEKYKINFPGLIVMETGGMKGKRKELIREELHSILCDGFGVSSIHSEYGMTELLSQAYSKGNGIFECPPWMKIIIRDMNDPFTFPGRGLSGGINIIDLANLNSCSFIATQDLGRLHSGGRFEVLGRFDNSDIRGCNLMVV